MPLLYSIVVYCTPRIKITEGEVLSSEHSPGDRKQGTPPDDRRVVHGYESRCFCSHAYFVVEL